jgi:hypothetical protein
MMSEAKFMPGKKYCSNCEPPAFNCRVELQFSFKYEQTVIIIIILIALLI